jgi:hypothetical protein
MLIFNKPSSISEKSRRIPILSFTVIVPISNQDNGHQCDHNNYTTNNLLFGRQCHFYDSVLFHFAPQRKRMIIISVSCPVARRSWFSKLRGFVLLCRKIIFARLPACFIIYLNLQFNGLAPAGQSGRCR